MAQKKNRFQVAKTMITLGLAAGLNYGIIFFLTPYITETIGIETYGFVSIAKTFVQYAQIFTIAMTTFVVRYIFVSYDQNKKEEAQSYYSSSLAGCFILAGGIFVLLLPVIFHLEIFLHIPSDDRSSVKLLFVLIFLNFIAQTVSIPLGVFAYIKDRLDLTGRIQIFSYLADAGVLLLLFHFFRPSVWFVGMGAFMSGLVTVACDVILSRKMIPDLRFQKKMADVRKVFQMLRNGIWDSLNSLGNVLNSGLDLIISNLMLDGIVTGQISVAKTIGTMYAGLYQLIFQPFQPNLLKAYSSGNRDCFMRELLKAIKICGCFSNILLAGFFALGKVYYRLWMPGQDTGTLYLLTVITIVTGLTAGAMKPIYYVYTLTVKNKIPCLVTICGGFFNIAGMYVLLRYTNLGALAVVVTTAVIMISINLFFNPVYAAKVLSVSVWPIYKVLFWHLVSAGVMTLVFGMMAGKIHPSEWGGLIGSAGAMAVVGVLIHSIIQGRQVILSRRKKGENTK